MELVIMVIEVAAIAAMAWAAGIDLFSGQWFVWMVAGCAINITFLTE